jgi:diguanylate cyclase (GGDEF)-like protein/PAS domain S-box-containing protein
MYARGRFPPLSLDDPDHAVDGSPDASLHVVHQRFESAFSNAPIGMALIDMRGHWLQVNDALCSITGYSRDELLEGSLAAITHLDDLDIDEQDRDRLLAAEIPSYQVEKRYAHARGRLGWALFTFSIVRDLSGSPLHLIAQVQDISDRKQAEGRLVYLTDHDFLTGTFNRRRFEQELYREIERSRRYPTGGAVVVLDLDNFKAINDAFGHNAGDDLLKGVTAALRTRMRHTDVLARFGGDEFAVMLPEVTIEEAGVVAGELVTALGHHTSVLGDQVIRVTASAGVAAFHRLSDSQVLAHADHAMYEAKRAGRNRVAIYSPTAAGRHRAEDRVDEAERLRRALQENRFELFCQPVLDLQTAEVSQYELLLRLRDGDDLVVPGVFLYAAERFGLIQAIDGWVIGEAVRLIAEHEKAGRSVALAVNLSGKSVGNRELATVAENAIAEHGIDATRLIFEVTESTVIANIEDAKRFATRMRRMGCRFALDDFGSGFGSFFYLKNLPFDYIKIDGNFVRGLAQSETDQFIVQAIARIAERMKKETIAEFVTDDAGLEILREAGVQYAQGYHIGRPAPVRDVLSSVA